MRSPYPRFAGAHRYGRKRRLSWLRKTPATGDIHGNPSVHAGQSAGRRWNRDRTVAGVVAQVCLARAAGPAHWSFAATSTQGSPSSRRYDSRRNPVGVPRRAGIVRTQRRTDPGGKRSVTICTCVLFDLVHYYGFAIGYRWFMAGRTGYFSMSSFQLKIGLAMVEFFGRPVFKTMATATVSLVVFIRKLGTMYICMAS